MNDKHRIEPTHVIHGEWHARYNYSVGKVAGSFLEGLKRVQVRFKDRPEGRITDFHYESLA
ncbi:MAG: hypothetical protein HY848_10625 [Betaproteobacteria bacterium]|nr:hypothetical protein [Betaproteobacteria bacterium]